MNTLISHHVIIPTHIDPLTHLPVEPKAIKAISHAPGSFITDHAGTEYAVREDGSLLRLTDKMRFNKRKEM